MARRRSSGYASRLHEIREDTRRAAKVRPERPQGNEDVLTAPQGEAVPVRPASAARADHVYCTNPESHATFHRLLRGSEPVCCVCGPKPGDS